LFAITSFPFMVQVFGNLGLINHLDFDFADRTTTTSRTISPGQCGSAKRWDKRISSKTFAPRKWCRGPSVAVRMPASFGHVRHTILEPHMSEFEAGGYKLGHRHPYEAIILTLNGKDFHWPASPA